MTSCSPLRYPGGKQVIAPVLARLIKLNALEGRGYAEPYAGGAGAALSLLFSGYVRTLRLNDADPAVVAMWRSILDETEEFVRRINSVPLSVAEWRIQRAVYLKADCGSSLDLGFATFYLNRVNRSGIIKNAGPIGGMEQEGTWKIDARFNRLELSKRVRRVASYKKSISLNNLDALEFLGSVQSDQVFVYLDPPYFEKGKELYLNHYKMNDHRDLSLFLRKPHPFKWVMSYDDTPEIRGLYKGFRKTRFSLAYSVRDCKVGSELLISSKDIVLPTGWCRKLPELRSVKLGQMHQRTFRGKREPHSQNGKP
jgi:DNA adenine methylase